MRRETDREDDGRWSDEVPDRPGVLAYAPTRDQAMASAKALALRAIADRIEHGETVRALDRLFAPQP